MIDTGNENLNLKWSAPLLILCKRTVQKLNLHLRKGFLKSDWIYLVKRSRWGIVVSIINCMGIIVDLCSVCCCCRRWRGARLWREHISSKRASRAAEWGKQAFTFSHSWFIVLSLMIVVSYVLGRACGLVGRMINGDDESSKHVRIK